MTSRTWNGSTGKYATAADWLPNGVPSDGDIALITSGTVTISGTDISSGVKLIITNGTSALPVVTLEDATIPADSVVAVTASGSAVTPSGSVQLAVRAYGLLTNNGTLIFDEGSGALAGLFLHDITGSKTGTFVNAGEIDIQGRDTQIWATATGTGIVNNGTIILTDPAAHKADYDVGAAMGSTISGIGTIRVGAGARLEIYGSVSAGQAVSLESGGPAKSILAIGTPGSFAGTIAGFGPSTRIELNVSPDDSHVVTASNGTTTLSFRSGNTVVASLTLIGTYTDNQFSFPAQCHEA